MFGQVDMAKKKQYAPARNPNCKTNGH